MQWKNRRLSVGLLAAVAIVVVVARMALVDHTSDTTGRVGSALPINDPPLIQPISRPVVTLGDLDPSISPAHTGTPFDPCTVVDEGDLPPNARPAEDTTASPQKPGEGDNFTVGCRLEYRATTGSSRHGKGFTAALVITITWGTTPPISLDPTSDPRAVAATFGGRTGVQWAETSPQGQRVCAGLVPAAGGAAGAQVINARFPSVDACAVTAAVLTTIARKIP